MFIHPRRLPSCIVLPSDLDELTAQLVDDARAVRATGGRPALIVRRDPAAVAVTAQANGDPQPLIPATMERAGWHAPTTAAVPVGIPVDRKGQPSAGALHKALLRLVEDVSADRDDVDRREASPAPRA